MSALYEACGGCGASAPTERCIGCLHDFGSVTPSNANTSGLDYFGYRVFNAGVGACWLVAKPGPNDTHPEPLVTAASAQARIAESEARVAELEAAKWEVKHVDTMNDMVAMGLARLAAEARADRLAKAGDRLVDALYRYGFPVSGGARVALTDRGSNEAVELDEAASNFRAALQQEG